VEALWKQEGAKCFVLMRNSRSLLGSPVWREPAPAALVVLGPELTVSEIRSLHRSGHSMRSESMV